MKITGIRLKPLGDRQLFAKLLGRIKGMITDNPSDNFEFLIEDDKRKSKIVLFGVDHINDEVVGKTIPIDKNNSIKFNTDGTLDIIDGKSESLIRKHSLEQLKRVEQMSKDTDIGKRINMKGENLISVHGLNNVESFEDFEQHNKTFIPNWNLKHLKSPFAK